MARAGDRRRRQRGHQFSIRGMSTVNMQRWFRLQTRIAPRSNLAPRTHISSPRPVRPFRCLAYWPSRWSLLRLFERAPDDVHAESAIVMEHQSVERWDAAKQRDAAARRD